MKLNGYMIAEQVLEARFNLPSAKKQRMKILDLKKQYSQEKDLRKKNILARQLKKAQSDLALRPNRSYSMYRDY